jgi:protein-arginine kinase activator protein McsA
MVGGERNGHGTRICRKVTCGKCQKVDYVAVSRFKKEDSLFCRECAKDELLAFEKGTRMKPEMDEVICCQCAKPFTFPKGLRKAGPLMCSDCYQGFEVWRGSLDKPAHEQEMAHLPRRPAGTLLRTNK